MKLLAREYHLKSDSHSDGINTFKKIFSKENIFHSLSEVYILNNIFFLEIFFSKYSNLRIVKSFNKNDLAKGIDEVIKNNTISIIKNENELFAKEITYYYDLVDSHIVENSCMLSEIVFDSPLECKVYDEIFKMENLFVIHHDMDIIFHCISLD